MTAPHENKRVARTPLRTVFYLFYVLMGKTPHNLKRIAHLHVWTEDGTEPGPDNPRLKTAVAQALTGLSEPLMALDSHGFTHALSHYMRFESPEGQASGVKVWVDRDFVAEE